MFGCYILYSASIDKFYIGSCQNGLRSRLEKHNNGFYGKHFTSQASDWALFHHIDCENLSQAVRMERHIKKMKSRKYLHDLKIHPAITEKLKLKYP